MAEKDLLSILDDLVKQAEAARDAARADDGANEVAQLKEALETRGEIGKAQGILMERYGLDADAAFDTLVRLSQHTNRKLRDVSVELVETGALPEDPTGRAVDA
jgi:AmiR/NasT family two-component response regulator